VPGDVAEKRLIFIANADLFNRNRTKELFKCDAFFVDLDKQPELLVDDTRNSFVERHDQDFYADAS
jgi:hypothetical protein